MTNNQVNALLFMAMLIIPYGLLGWWLWESPVPKHIWLVYIAGCCVIVAACLRLSIVVQVWSEDD